MKQFLLLGLLSAAAFGASADIALKTVSVSSPLQSVHSISKSSPRQSAKIAAADGYALYESFEGWDGTDNEWIPDGWTVDMRGEVERTGSWTPATAVPNTPLTPSDGRVMYAINYSKSAQDEWLISPEFTVENGMNLSYYVYLSPMYLFSDVASKQVASTLQVWAGAEGEEWVMLHDFVDDYKNMSLDELYDADFSGLEKRTESLAQYAGKKTQVAFRVVGVDGNTMALDEVTVGLPPLEGVSYMEPFSTLYWGFDRSAGMAGLMADMALLPVYEPVTWTNMMWDDTAQFIWTYTDPETGRAATSNNRDELTLTFYPDYTNEETKRNNLFLPPLLTATAPLSTPGEYQAPYAYFQAGGKPGRTLADGTDLEFSLLPFGYNNSGLTSITVDDSEIGDFSLPVFGYNVNSDRYWLNYSLNGNESIDGNYSHLEGIANLFMPTAAPLVVSGINVYGYGRFAKDAEFVATIYGVNEEMSRDFSTLTVIASDTITGAEVLGLDVNLSNTLCFPFDFDEPVVVKATEEHPAYFIMFSGFRSEKVTYFAPYQAAVPDPNFCWGYILNEICLNGHGELAGDEPYVSLKPMSYKENGEYVDPYAAFAIGLNAEYPWLTTDCEGLELAADVSEVTAAIGSYYDGSQLTVEASEGLVATVEGRYDECVLTVSRDGFMAVDGGSVTVKGPGVEVTIPVKAEEAGIADVSVDGNARVTDVYDLSGRRVSSAAKGIYLLKASDGSVRKAILK